MNALDYPALACIEEKLQELPLTPQDCQVIMATIRARVAASPLLSESATKEADVALARRIHSSRTRGNSIFGARILCDPRFEMLLDLFVSKHMGRQVCISDLSVGSGVPQTTGLRHIDALEAAGFVRREPDPSDSRRCWVEPTDRALVGITALLHDLRRQANTPPSAPMRSADMSMR